MKTRVCIVWPGSYRYTDMENTVNTTIDGLEQLHKAHIIRVEINRGTFFKYPFAIVTYEIE